MKTASAPDQKAQHEELREGAGQALQRGQQAPREDPGREEVRPARAVGHASERDAHHRVEQREGGAEGAHRGVAERPFPPDRLRHGRDHLAIEEVQSVDGAQHDQRRAHAAEASGGCRRRVFLQSCGRPR